MKEPSFWIDLIDDDIDVDLHDAALPRPTHQGSLHAFGIPADDRHRKPVGSVVSNIAEKTAFVGTLSSASVRTVAESPEDAVRRFLERDTVDPDTPEGCALWLRLRNIEKERVVASGA